jgi:hypothetical protein
LGSTLSGTAVEPLEIVPHALKRTALLIDLPTQPAAPWRRIAEDGEKSGRFTAGPARLRHQTVDFELLTVDRVFDSANLFDASRIGVASIERCELGFQPLAGRIGRLRMRRGEARQRQQGNHSGLAG